MSNKEYVRKHKEDRPVVAICYDFDKTLSPDDMQAQGFIQDIGYDVDRFGKSRMSFLIIMTWTRTWLICIKWWKK